MHSKISFGRWEAGLHRCEFYNAEAQDRPATVKRRTSLRDESLCMKFDLACIER